MASENESPAERKTMKVSLPVEQHLKLHAIKILEGQNLSESVRRALEAYFEEVGIEDADLSQDTRELLGLRGASGGT